MTLIFMGIVFALAIMAAVSYMALNKKSTFIVRMVSLGALAVMIITVIICLIIVFSDPSVVVDMSTYIVSDTPPEVKKDNNIAGLLFSIIFFLALFVVIAFLALKEHKKSLPKKGEVTLTIY